MHPSDPSGSPGNIINCRCQQVAAQLVNKKTLTLNHYDQIRFYSYQDMQRDQAVI